MRKAHKQKRPTSPDCAAPGCPLRYTRATNNGRGYCAYHYGVQSSDDVSQITRNIYTALPLLRQLKLLRGLHAGQIIGRDPIPIVPDLNQAYQQQDGELVCAWRSRLEAAVNKIMQHRTRH